MKIIINKKLVQLITKKVVKPGKKQPYYYTDIRFNGETFKAAYMHPIRQDSVKEAMFTAKFYATKKYI